MRFPKLTRSLIANAKGKPVEIIWPEDAPAPERGHTYTVQSSHHRKGSFSIVVKAAEQLPDERWRATVAVAEEQRPLRLSAKVAPDPKDELQFRPEYEPEQVDAAYQRLLDEDGEITTRKCGASHRDARSERREESKRERSHARLERLMSEAPK